MMMAMKPAAPLELEPAADERNTKNCPNSISRLNLSLGLAEK